MAEFPCELCSKTIKMNDIPNHTRSKKHLKALRHLSPSSLYTHLYENGMYRAMNLPDVMNLIFKCDPCKLALWADKNSEKVKECHFRSHGHQVAVGENNIHPEDGHRCPLCNVFVRKKWVVKHINGPEHKHKFNVHRQAIQDTEKRLQHLFEIKILLEDFENYQEYDEAEEFVMDLFNTDDVPMTADNAEESEPNVPEPEEETPKLTVDAKSDDPENKVENIPEKGKETDIQSQVVVWVAEQRLQKKPILLPNVMHKFGISREKALEALEKK